MKFIFSFFIILLCNLILINSWAIEKSVKNQKILPIANLAKQFEKEGGKGTLFTIRDFISETDDSIQGFQLKQLPKSADQNSFFRWLRTSDSRSLVEELLKEGACIFIVRFPDSAPEGALTIDDKTEGISELLEKVDAPPVNGAILFLRQDSTKDVISHEGQHWRDAKKVQGSRKSLLNDLFEDIIKIYRMDLGLKKEHVSYLYRFIFEQRGYATQQIELANDSKKQLSYVPDIRGSGVLTGEKATTARIRASHIGDEIFFETFQMHNVFYILDQYKNTDKHGNLQSLLLKLFEKYLINGYEKLEFKTMFKKYL